VMDRLGRGLPFGKQQWNTVDEADGVRAALGARTFDPDLVGGKKMIGTRIRPVDHPHGHILEPAILAADFDPHSVNDLSQHFAVGGHRAERRTVAEQFVLGQL